MRQFSIDPDIRRAETLPSWVYSAPESYEVQRETVFARSWQYIEDAERVKAPGHVLPVTLLPGCLDEPLVLSRDDAGTLHCLSNVCTHRGTVVVEGEAHVRGLRCRYHGRRFGLDGCFHSMPEFDEVEHFPSVRDNLAQLPLERFGPLLFTSLSPAPKFDEWVAPVRERLSFLPLEQMRFDAATSRDYHMRANWALYCDNYLEEFHIPYVHPNSLSGLDYGAYATELYAHGSLQIGVGKSGDDAFDLPAGHPDHGKSIVAYYYWLFPNLMLNFYPWGVSVNVVYPLAPDRTRVSFRSYVLDSTRRERGVGGNLHRVEMEDEEIVESVQRGVSSRIYERGRYSPRREGGTHHFHRILAGFMNAASSATS
jgi:choline monooxygenase